MRRPDAPDEYRPTSRRQRLLILALAIVTAVVVVLAMLGPKLRAMQAEQAHKAAGPAPCTAQQTQGCVGGTMGVITPPPGAASAPR